MRTHGLHSGNQNRTLVCKVLLLILGAIYVFKHIYMQNVIFTPLKLWVAVARHRFKWVKILRLTMRYSVKLNDIDLLCFHRAS